MEKGGFQTHPLMRLTLGLTLLFLVAFWLTNFAVYFSRMSLRPSSVVAYYNGSEADYRPPRSFESMLETTHMHLPMMGMVLLFLTHLAIFVPLPKPAKTTLVATTFTSAAFEEGAGWLVRFLSPVWAPLKVIGFVGLQAAILFLLSALALFLWKAWGAPVPAVPGRKHSRRSARDQVPEPARSGAEAEDEEPASAEPPRAR
jgi:hypothetical protein